MELPAPRDNQFLFLDMNAFFASCEQHHQPQLRGKPVAVTPTLAPSGCVIAASYEAKRLGVTTGCRVGEARERIPTIVVVESNHRYYASIHTQLAQFLTQEITPDLIRLSVDEFAIPLDCFEQWTPNAHALALKIKQRLAQIFSPALRCSIGIGPNLFLAKLGTEIQKPDGLVMIQLHQLVKAYEPLKLRDIPGINWGMSNQLNSLGIRTPGELFSMSRPRLHTSFGIMGDAWWYNLHGYKVDHKESPTKSMSHSHVLAPQFRTKTEARAILYKLFLKVIERLRDKHLATTRLAISIRGHHEYWKIDITVRPSQNPFGLFRPLAVAYDTDLPAQFRPAKITVVAWDLAPYQPSWLGLFPEDNHKIQQLFTAVDDLNSQYGRWTVKPASLLKVKDSAPNRITFRVPDFEMD